MSIDPELLAAYIDKRLPPEQRAAVEAQLAGDPESYAVLVDSLKTLEAMSEAEGKDARPIPFPAKKTNRLWVIGGGALAAAAAIVLVTWTQPELLRRLGWNAADPLIARLVIAAGDERYVEARLTGGFHYGPLKTPTRSAVEVPQNLSLVAEAGQLQKLVTDSPTPERLHALGVALLLIGQHQRAIDLLEDAAEARPGDAAIQNDLAAAYLAAAAEIPDALPRALEAASRAQQSDPALVEPAFVRALALEKMGLRQQAIAAWTDYLRRDSESAWGADARARLERLSRERDPVSSQPPPELGKRLLSSIGNPSVLDDLIAADSQNVRRFLELDWLEPSLASGGTFDRVEIVADRFSRFTGDRLPVDLYSGLRRQSPADRRIAVASLVRAAAASDASRFDELSDVGGNPPIVSEKIPPLRMWLEYYRLHALSQMGKIDEAITGLRILQREAEVRSYLHLEGVVLNRIGQGFGRLGDQQPAIETRLKAIELFRRTNDLDQVASMQAMLSECYRLLGDVEGALDAHWQSLALNSSLRSHRTRNQVLMQAGLTMTRAAFHSTAAAFYREAEDVGRQWTTYPSAVVSAQTRLAESLSNAGLKAEAREAIQLARAGLAQIPDQGFRRRNELDLLEVESEIAVPDRAVAMLDEAISSFHDTGYDVRLPRLYRVKGSVLQRQHSPGALDAFDSGLNYLEQTRSSLLDPALRATQLDLFTSLQQGAAESLLLDGNEEAAIERLDSIKARSSDEHHSSSQSPSAWRELLKPGTGILFLAEVGGQTHEWVFASGGRAHVGSVSTQVVARHARAFRRALLRHDDEAARLASQRLSALLFAKVSSNFSAVDTLIVVPTKVLSGIPFSALTRQDGKFFAETFTITIAPSLSMLRRAAMTPVKGNDQIALIAAGASAEGRSPLNLVDEETRAIAGLYTRPEVLTGAVNKQTLLNELSRATVFHFSGHSTTSPSGVGLLLGDSPDGAAIVSQSDVLAQRLDGLKVVLAACASAYVAGPRQSVDASLALAGTFLAAGAASVAGTLWDIEDDDAARLSLAIHRELVQGQSVAAAIANVQRSEINARRPMSEWSAIVAVGSGS